MGNTGGGGLLELLLTMVSPDLTRAFRQQGLRWGEPALERFLRMQGPPPPPRPRDRQGSGWDANPLTSLARPQHTQGPRR